MEGYIAASAAHVGRKYINVKGSLVTLIGPEGDKFILESATGARTKVGPDYLLRPDPASTPASAPPVAGTVEPLVDPVVANLAGRSRDHVEPHLKNLSDEQLQLLARLDTREWVGLAASEELRARKNAAPTSPRYSVAPAPAPRAVVTKPEPVVLEGVVVEFTSSDPASEISAAVSAVTGVPSFPVEPTLDLSAVTLYVGGHPVHPAESEPTLELPLSPPPAPVRIQEVSVEAPAPAPADATPSRGWCAHCGKEGDRTRNGGIRTHVAAGRTSADGNCPGSLMKILSAPPENPPILAQKSQDLPAETSVKSEVESPESKQDRVDALPAALGFLRLPNPLLGLGLSPSEEATVQEIQTRLDVLKQCIPFMVAGRSSVEQLRRLGVGVSVDSLLLPASLPPPPQE